MKVVEAGGAELCVAPPRNLRGNFLETGTDDMADEEMAAGRHTLTFNGSDLSSGIYFIRVTAYDETQIVKAVLMK